jgi:putative Holliday junction resolvase
MRTLALDYGERRIGVAVTDPTGVLAQPLETITRRDAEPDAHLKRIDELASEYEVGLIVVGLPLHMDGRAGPEADRARAFGAEVRERTGIPVEFVDERWSSAEAERVLSAAGVRARKRRGRVDPLAAALILETHLRRSAS